jgi:hypothetical protein
MYAWFFNNFDIFYVKIPNIFYIFYLKLYDEAF